MSGRKNNDVILKRILRPKKRLTISALFKGNIGQTDIQSLLLKLYESLVSRIKPRDIMRQYHENRFVKPCDIGQKELALFEKMLYAVAPKEFEAIELSPVSPLGINSVLSKINQKNVLSTIRNIEVVADVTTVLTLECAERRRKIIQKNPLNDQEIHLCSVHRSIRLQKFAQELGFTPHFKVFGACSAGRDIGYEKFESENLIRHISAYLDLLKISGEADYLSQNITVALSDIRIAERLIEYFKLKKEIIGRNTQTKDFNLFQLCQIDIPGLVLTLREIPEEKTSQYGLAKPIAFLTEIERKTLEILRSKYPKINFLFDFKRIAGIGYYENLCFKITAENKKGEIFPLADGGVTDWTKKLLASKKERIFISGFGNELFCRNFKNT